MSTAPHDSVGRAPGNPLVRRTVALLFAAWFIDYADRLVINFVLPDLGRAYGLSHGEQGLIVTAFFLAYALCQLPGGLLTDRLGARRVMLWAVLAWSAFTALTGLVWSFAALLVTRFAFGVAEGAFPPASMKALAERTPPEGRMRANGVVMSSNAFASIAVPVMIAPLVGAFGWRSAFFLSAVLGLAVYAALRFRLPCPRAVPTSESAPESASTPASAGGAAGSARRPVPWALLRRPVLWRFALIMFGHNVIMWGLVTWIPTYLSEERGLPLAHTGWIMAIPALGVMAGTVAGGRLADRLGGHHLRVIGPAMAVTTVALVLLAILPGLTAFVLCGTVAVCSTSLAHMPLLSVPMRGLPEAAVGSGTAVIMFGGQLGGMVAPPLTGLLADAYSFQAAFGFLIAGAVLAAGAAALTPQDVPAFRKALLRSPRKAAASV